MHKRLDGAAANEAIYCGAVSTNAAQVGQTEVQEALSVNHSNGHTEYWLFSTAELLKAENPAVGKLDRSQRLERCYLI